MHVAARKVTKINSRRKGCDHGEVVSARVVDLWNILDEKVVTI